MKKRAVRSRFLAAASFAALAALAALAAAGAAHAGPGGLAPPVRIEAAGEPIDVDVGHAAPFVVDFDGDGKPDLLVGQFGGGRLRIYRNAGTAARPRFEAPTWFEAGGAEGTVPAG